MSHKTFGLGNIGRVKNYVEGVFSIVDPMNHPKCEGMEISGTPGELMSQAWNMAGGALTKASMDQLGSLNSSDKDLVLENY